MSDYDANQMIIPLADELRRRRRTSTPSGWRSTASNVIKTLKIGQRDAGQAAQFAPKERFWSMTMATLMVGAGARQPLRPDDVRHRRS